MRLADRVSLGLLTCSRLVRPYLTRGWSSWLSISLGLCGCAALPVVQAASAAAQSAAATRSAGFVIDGSQPGDNSGESVRQAGDVNGDGIPDLIVGAIFASPNGRSFAGRSYVVFGKRNGQPIELSGLESGSSKAGFAINGSQPGDQSGDSVSGAGDINGDGLADLIVGAPDASPNGHNRAGRSYVVFGKRNNQPVELAALDNGTSQAGFVIDGSQANDYSGVSVSSAGDINGDGIPDLIVGALGASPDGRAGAGRSYVVFGKHDSQSVELSSLEDGTSQAGFVIDGSQPSDASGVAVDGAGDVNGDGIPDLIVGAFLADPGGHATAGRSYVVFGKHDSQSVELSSLEDGTGQAGFVIDGSQVEDHSGISVGGAGDVNGDGLADLVVGTNPEQGAGRSYVIFGKSALQPVELADIDNGTSQAGFVIDGSQPFDRAGSAVGGAGDVNGDGLADVIVGAPGADPASQSSAGRSYVVFGKTNSQPVQLSGIDTGSNRAGFVIDGSQANDNSGTSVSGAGDVNGDGLADVIVGAPGADPAGQSSAGRSYVVFGKRNSKPVELSGLKATSPAP
ncbi:integrin alpha [Gloeobacter kilaueensis]|uniref:FG-GAP repeat-containing protein n=1 Tax=Gloeobacter kilaueensis (strain ATCC BAA-2537 / CCAP 1431/1 / ULC 316 / JS1) TaxID=1183438 RepID=U5QHD1_GLOK1|nr:integrin alpha [Gloeobacter kilaueensis]AGY57044.1 FG-GAP repeat-containing protein [Gloeobacter kilaueensis JS1]